MGLTLNGFDVRIDGHRARYLIAREALRKAKELEEKGILRFYIDESLGNEIDVLVECVITHVDSDPGFDYTADSGICVNGKTFKIVWWKDRYDDVERIEIIEAEDTAGMEKIEKPWLLADHLLDILQDIEMRSEEDP